MSEHDERNGAQDDDRQEPFDAIAAMAELDRALESARQTGGPEQHLELVSGLEQVQHRFLAILKRHGVRPCPALGTTPPSRAHARRCRSPRCW